jgi:hypothetical protein
MKNQATTSGIDGKGIFKIIDVINIKSYHII